MSLNVYHPQLPRRSAVRWQDHTRRRHSSATYYALIALWMAALTVDAYPDGAPDMACVSMMPQHGVEGQTSAGPFSIATSTNSYSSGTQISVTVSASSSSFTGLLIQARLSSNGAAVGTFTSIPSGFKSACSSTAVTQTNKNSVTTASFVWTAPSTSGQGNIYFVATVVRSYQVFWTNIRSATIMDTSSPSGSSATQSSTVQPNRPILNQVLTNVDTTSCDVSKACFLNGCSGTSCKYVLTWAPGTGGLTVVFEMEAAVSSMNSWVAFGLSTDKKMGSDSVIECVYNSQSGVVDVHVSWNNGHNNQLSSDAPQLGLVSGSASGAYINGRITCRFERVISVSSSSSSIVVYPLDSASYYILMALGRVTSGTMQEHTDTAISSGVVNITAYTSAADTRKNLTKAHGILMVLAWMMFASAL